MATTIELPGKVPPQSLEAERAVLGAILLEPALLPRAIELLIPEEFYKEAHRKIFGAMIRLFERGEPADAITVTETLRREGVFEEIGGHTLLATLQEEGTVATQFTAYTGIVREKALLRELIRVAREIVEEGYEETDDVQALLDRAEQMLFRISPAAVPAERVPRPRDPRRRHQAHRDAVPPQGGHHRAGHGVHGSGQADARGSSGRTS